MKTILKTILVNLIFFSGTNAFAQIAPGCGTVDIKFDVSTKDSQVMAAPDPGKALIYFLQDDTNFASHPRPTTRFGLDGKWIGATHANSYFYLSVDPGEHHLCANWQSIVGLGIGLRTAAAHFTAGVGGVYFFVAHDRYSRETPAEIKLLPMDSDEAQLFMRTFALATSHPKK